MNIPRLLTSLSRLLLLAVAAFGGLSTHAANMFPSVLSVGPFNYPGPSYFYVNTKIPFSDGVAPQIHITGYLYAGGNRAMDVTLGWYVYNNVFYWTQYHSELSFAKPSRIRLGTYDDAGTTRVRIEIANDGVYWASYFVSATDILGYDPHYTDWSYAEGAMPGTTGSITEVPLQGDVQIFGNLTAANFSNGTISGSSSGLTLNAGGTNQNITLTPSGTGHTILNGNVGIGTASPGAKLQVGSWTRIKDGTWADPATPNAVSAGERLVFYEGGGWKTGIGMGGQNDIWFQAHTPGGQPAFRWFTGGPSAVPMERMRIMESGNVGIGTSAPNQQLSINGNLSVGSTGSFIMMGQSAYTGGGGYIFLKSTGDNGRDFNIQNYSNAAGWRTNLFVGGESGNVGIGTQSPDSRLKISQTLTNPVQAETVNIEQPYSITANDTDYIKALDIEKYWYNIPSGVTANGYQIGIASQVFVSDTNFQGTIAEQFGIWSRTGINVAGASGPRTVNNAYGIYLDGLNGAGTILNHYGVYQTGAGTKNYFAGNVGIGTTTPAKKLHVAGTGSLQVDPNDGSIELASGNDGMAYIDFKGSTNLGADYRGRMLYADGTGFTFSTGQSYSNQLVIREGGNVGIGTDNPTQKLSVNGTIRAKEIIVDTNWADYGFDESYTLAPLSDVEAHIKAKKHLPGIPSAAEIAEHGVSMGDMQSKLLSKIEELTLHMIAQEKLMTAQQSEIATLRQQVGELKAAAQP